MEDAEIRPFLNELFKKGQQNDARKQERNKKMLNLDPETASLATLPRAYLHQLQRR